MATATPSRGSVTLQALCEGCGRKICRTTFRDGTTAPEWAWWHADTGREVCNVETA